MKTTLKHFCFNKEVSKEKGKSLTLNKEVLLYIFKKKSFLTTFQREQN